MRRALYPIMLTPRLIKPSLKRKRPPPLDLDCLDLNVGRDNRSFRVVAAQQRQAREPQVRCAVASRGCRPRCLAAVATRLLCGVYDEKGGLHASPASGADAALPHQRLVLVTVPQVAHLPEIDLASLVDLKLSSPLDCTPLKKAGSLPR